MFVKNSKNILTRVGLTFLAGLFFVNQTVLAHAAETNFWRERRLAMASDIPHQDFLSPIASAFNETADSDSRDLASLLTLVSREGGSVQKEVSVHSPRATVIHIQDVHGNLDAQRSIRRLIELLAQKGGIKLIGLEGAHGNLPFSTFSQLDQRTREETADAFLNRLDIGGPVHFALTQPHSGISFVGVDDSVLFRENWAAVRRVASTAKALGKILTVRAERLEKEKDGVLNPALRSFDRNVQAYRGGQLLVGDYVDVLSRHVLISTPNLAAFQRARIIGKGFSAEALEAERAKFLLRLMGRLSSEDQAGLLRLTANVGSGKISERSMYVRLDEYSNKAAVPFPRTLHDYLAYLEISEGVDSNHLVSEIREMEARVYGQLIRTSKEKKIIEAAERQLLAQKLVDFSLTPDEWRTYRNSPEAGRELAGFRPAFEIFFALARKRDQALAGNLCAALRASGTDRAILVTGGFHSPGIQAALAEKNIDVVTVTPHFNVVESVSNANSLLAVANKKVFFTDMFPDGNDFLPQPTWTPGLHLSFVLSWMALAGTQGVKITSAAANHVLSPISRRLSPLGTFIGRTFFLVRAKSGVEFASVQPDGNGFVTTSVTPIGPSLVRRLARVLPKFGLTLVPAILIISISLAGAQTVPSGSGMVPSTGGGGLGDLLTTALFFGFRTFTIFDWILIPLGAALAGQWLAFVYEKAHPRGNNDPDMPNALRLIPPMFGLLFMLLQQNLLLGIGGFLGPAAMFRNRVVSRDQDDQTSLMQAMIIGFAASVTRGFDEWGLVLLALAVFTFTRVMNHVQFMHGDKVTPDGTLTVEEIPGGNSDEKWERLWKLIDIYATRSDYYRVAANPRTISFDFRLKNPTNAGPLTGFEGFRFALMILFKDQFNFTFVDKGRGKSSGVTFGPNVQFGTQVIRSLIIGGILFGGASLASAAELGTALFSTARPDQFLGFGVGLAIVVLLILKFRQHMGGRLPDNDEQFRRRLERAQAGEIELPPEDLARLYKGPRSSSVMRGFVQWTLRRSMRLAFGLLLALFLSLLVVQKTGERPSSLMMGSTRASQQTIEAPVEGILTMLVDSYQAVHQGQLIGYIDPLDSTAIELEAKSIRERYEGQIAQAKVNLEQALGNLQGRIGPLKLSLAMKQGDIALHEVTERYLQGYFERGQQSSASVTKEALEQREQAWMQMKKTLEGERIEAAKIQAEIEALEKNPTAPGAVAEDGSFGKVLGDYEALMKQINESMSAEVAKFEYTFRRRPITAAFDGQVMSLFQNGVHQVRAAAPIATVTSSQPPTEVIGFCPEASRLPKVGEDVWVKNAAGESVRGQVTWVGNASEEIPSEIQLQQSISGQPPANRRGTGRFMETTRGRPFTVYIVPNPQFGPGMGVSIMVWPHTTSTNASSTLPHTGSLKVDTSSNKPAAQPPANPPISWTNTSGTNASETNAPGINISETGDSRTNASGTNTSRPTISIRGAGVRMGQLDGRAVRVASVGVPVFPTSFTELSGAAVDAAKNLLYLEDDGAERIEVYDIATGRLVNTIDIAFLRQKDDTKAPDVEAIAFDAVTGKLVLALETQQRIVIINPSDPTNSVETFTTDFKHVEGLTIHPVTGQIYLANSPSTKNPDLYRVALNRLMRRVDVVKKIDLSAANLAPIRDLAFIPVNTTSGVRYDLLLLESGDDRFIDRRTLRRLVVDGPDSGKLLSDQVTVPDSLKKPEALTMLPDGRIFVGSETKNVGGQTQVILEVTPAQPSVPSGSGTNAPGTNASQLMPSTGKNTEGLYGFWLEAPILGRLFKTNPILASVIGATLESCLPAVLFLISNQLWIAAFWVLANGLIKLKFGFVGFNPAGFPVRSTATHDKLGFVRSNLVSWTSMSVFLLNPSSPVWFVFIAALGLHAFADFVIAAQATSLRKIVASTVRKGHIILTVMDESKAQDLAQVADIKRVLADPSLADYQNQLVVVDLTSKKDLPPDVAIPGPTADDRGLFHVEEILGLAQVALQGKIGSFALVSSRPDLLLIPDDLKNRIWDIRQLFGFWSLEPRFGVEDRIMESLHSLLFA